MRFLICGDRDVRRAEPGESYEDKGRKLLEGIRTHYADVCAKAERIRQQLDRQIPIIAMGHLFTTTINFQFYKEITSRSGIQTRLIILKKESEKSGWRIQSEGAINIDI